MILQVLLFTLLLESRSTIAFQGFLSTSASTLRRSLRQQAVHHPTYSGGFYLLKRFSSSSESSFSEEDLARWDRLYSEGGATFADSSSGSIDLMLSRTSEVKVVSFDLDNTLWKTYGCINAANDALAAFLDEHKIEQPKRVEKIMGELFLADKTRYSPILGEEATSATLLTLLRTDAIQKVLEDYNDYSKSGAETFAQTAFCVWATARHDAIPNNLAINVLECLETISKLKTSQGHKILIGAITDGNSDPRRVQILEKYFDFCVNAEQVGVSKPDKRVYLEAVRQAASHPSAKDILSIDMESIGGEIEVGPYWVHVGDDFVKDIVAAKELKMRTVWATELVRDKLQAKISMDGPSKKASSGDDADVKDFVKRISEKTVVELSIGADSYLADSFTEDFVDAVTEEFHHLSSVITEWHAEGVSANPAVDSDMAVEPTPSLEVAAVEPTPSSKVEAQPSDGFSVEDIISVVTPDTEPYVSGSNSATQVPARAFRIGREEFSSDVAAPLRDRDSRTMQEVMGIAQLDRSSGVFAFAPEDVGDVRVGKKVLMIKVGCTDLEFSREIFSKMTVQDVLSLSDENPLKLSLYIKEASSAPSFDLF